MLYQKLPDIEFDRPRPVGAMAFAGIDRRWSS